MSFAAHGFWCGPGWSAGQWKDAKDLTEEDKKVPALDALDQACKNHDIAIAEGDENANPNFYEEAAANGWFGTAMAAAVALGGPPSHSYLRGKDKMVKTRKSVKDDEEYYEAWKSANSIRLRQKKARQETVGDQRIKNWENSLEEEEETKDNDVIDALVRMNEFETPDRPVMRPAPVLTRSERRPGQHPELGPAPVVTRSERQAGEPLSNLLDQVDNEMATRDVEMTPMALSVSGGDSTSNNQRGSRETTVKYNMRAEMGIFTETRTAYLPITFFLSINNVRRNAPIPLRIRVDWPYNILKGNTLTRQEIIYNGGSYTRARGLSNDMVQSNERTQADQTGSVNSIDPGINKDQLTPFPCTIVGDIAKDSTTTAGNRYSSSGTISDFTCIPAYRKWYAPMYDWAHCMETDYRITYFSSDQNESFQNMMVFEGMNCVSDNNTARIPEDQDLQKVMHWPHLKTHRIAQRTSEKPQREYVISGTWKDSDQYAMKMVPNEEDQKTWTAMGSADFTDRLLNYREEICLLHYSDYDSTHTPAYFNVRVDLRYKVQFRDLANSYRFLGTSNRTLESNYCVQVPNSPEIIKGTNVTAEL